ncbi:hypothetical protein ACLOJK_014918 [Asimina triloba]
MGSSRRWAKFKQLANVISYIIGNVDGPHKGAARGSNNSMGKISILQQILKKKSSKLRKQVGFVHVGTGGAMQCPTMFLASNGHHQHFHFNSKAADQQTQQLAYKQQHLATFSCSRGVNRDSHLTIQNRSQQRLQAWQNSANRNVINVNSSLLVHSHHDQAEAANKIRGQQGERVAAVGLMGGSRNFGNEGEKAVRLIGGQTLIAIENRFGVRARIRLGGVVWVAFFLSVIAAENRFVWGVGVV